MLSDSQLSLSLIRLSHDLGLLPLQQLPNQSTNTMSGLLTSKLDIRPLHTLGEDNRRTRDAGEISVLLSRECTEPNGLLELSGADYRGVALRDGIKCDFDTDNVFGDIIVRDGGRGGSATGSYGDFQR